jgi:DNA-binding CsgD family transcriptional regulator
MTARETSERGLLERDEQLERAAAAIARLRAGRGGVLVISGPAGIGKTALLESIVDDARADGINVLLARGVELERDLGHGVTRQLLDPALAAVDDAERAALLEGAAALAAPVLGLTAPSAVPAADPEFAARHGLTWLLSGLADLRPVLVALDDAQWADPPALRWLAYLAQRLDQAPVMVLLTRRSAEPCAEEAALDAICAAGHELRLAPLSPVAVAELVRVRTGMSPDAELVARCVAASGGNPFLLDATLAALAEEGMSALGQPFAGAPSVARTIMRRLARLPTDASKLARAVAVLGDGAELAIAASLAGMTISCAAQAADALVLADLFTVGENLSFTHGLVRDAVTADIGAHAMSAAHAHAAHVLRSFGAPPERIASHLLHAPAARDAHATEDLRAAARRSLAQGAPTTATTLLRRALAEPPPPAERGAVLLELGMTELASGAPGAADRLGEAIEALDDVTARTAAVQAQTIAFIGQNRVDDAADTIERFRPMLTNDADALLALDALRLTLPLTYVSRAAGRRDAAAQLRDALRDADPTAVGTRGTALLVAAFDAIEGRRSSEVRAAVYETWGDGDLLDELGPEHGFCVYSTVSLWIAGELSAMELIATQIADRAAADGSVIGACHAWMLRAIARQRMGKLADAEADADLVLQSGSSPALSLARAIAQAVLASVEVERDNLPSAQGRLIDIDVASDVIPTILTSVTATARLAHALGDGPGEREALRRLQRLSPLLDFGTWSMCVWPADLSIALGPSAEARDLADDALADACARGRPGEIGLALRAQALVEPGRPDIERLRVAATKLAGSELALVYARTLVDLGAALRRGGHRREARSPLAVGLERALGCGATALVERARIELQATGARPRRLATSGRDALTPSERRIALLAAEGRSNREIAQTLFVTGKTVETHLSHTYRKLDITGRAQLARELQD